MKKNDHGKIIFLNGTSSSGKSTLAKELQEQIEDSCIHLSLDDLWPRLPEKMVGQDEFWKKFELGKYETGFHHSIAGYSSAGVGVIVDHACVSEGIKQCIELLRETRVVFVEVKCPVHELRKREEERGDRINGLAESQIPLFETFKETHIYDLEVDTSKLKPDECTRMIIDILDDNRPTAFDIMRTDKKTANQRVNITR